MHWVAFGVLLAIAVVVAGALLLFDRRAGVVRVILMLAAALAGAWLADLTAGWWRLGGVLVVPAVIGALAGGLLLRSLVHRVEPRRRVEKGRDDG